MDKFDDLLNKEKEKIKSQKLSKEFKTELANKLNLEYENNKNNENTKKNNIFYKYRKIAAAFACCLIISGFVFADNIENWVSSIFSNVDENVEFSIEDDNVQNVNSEYVTCNDVAINVEYVYYDDYNLYIACNIKNITEFEYLCFKNVEFKDKENNVIYSNIENNNIYKFIKFDIDSKRLNTNNAMIVLHLYSNDEVLKNIDNIKILLNNLMIENNSDDIINGTWNFNVNINR